LELALRGTSETSGEGKVLSEAVADSGGRWVRPGGVADGALISAARFGTEDGAAIAALVRGFRAHAIVGLVDDLGERGALGASLRMGQLGIRSLVDLRTPQGGGTSAAHSRARDSQTSSSGARCSPFSVRSATPKGATQKAGTSSSG
jgi:hypothetical protein